MNTLKKLSVFLMLAAALPVLAATKTVTLTVPSMTCPVCPITVKKALQSVPGVSKVNISFAKKEVAVTFDDAKTNVAALTHATADAGYPSTAKDQPGSGNTVSGMVSGGQIAVSVKSRNVVELASNRFTCGSCARRVIPQIKALRGVSGIRFSPSVGISQNGSAANGLIGALTVTFDPSKVTIHEIAVAAKSALEADPYNRRPVALLYQTQTALR